ncbi:MAG: hypothetical protein CM1200mP10_31770 [Candidatus Neomarinimicrobiota bacterium]|nr:MAG: hypothetical protein CM1200mP10_31770 [Candidatus Neomarinimicrobiota bacterium]
MPGYTNYIMNFEWSMQQDHRTGNLKFDTTSFKAKPSAKPVTPNPATRADTFMPIVPNAVTSQNY